MWPDQSSCNLLPPHFSVTFTFMSFCGGFYCSSTTSSSYVISGLLIRIVSCGFFFCISRLLSYWVYSHSWFNWSSQSGLTSKQRQWVKVWASATDHFILLIILQVKTAVRRVFCSYLSLLVNSKNDMALAQTLDVPSRCLGRQAFTDIKRAAQKSNTSLFLVTNTQPSRCSFTSFITVKQQMFTFFSAEMLRRPWLRLWGPSSSEGKATRQQSLTHSGSMSKACLTLSTF